MNRILLDSDIIIWHLRGRKEITEALKDIQKSGLPACSALSVLEVQLGVKKGEEEKTGTFFNSLKVIPVDLEVARQAAQLIRGLKAKGITMDLPDAVIAATCILHDLVLFTHNQRHYPIPHLSFYSP